MASSLAAVRRQENQSRFPNYGFMPSTPTLSSKQLTRAEALLAEGVSEGLYTHAAYALARGGQTVAVRAFGAAREDTRFDLASLTKPLAGATCLLQLVEDGRVPLRVGVGGFFEDEFGPLPHLSGVEVRHLLTHTSGLPPVPRWPRAGEEADRKERLRHVLTTPTLRPPGAGYTYSDTGYILLGEITARVAGRPLDVCFAEGVAGPLGRATLGFCPAEGGDIAPTSADAPGTVHDPRARALGGVAGHAGLFGTAGDVLAFAEAIRTSGGPILSRATAARMAVSQIPAEIGAQSWGWFCAGNDYLPAGDLFSGRAFGHSGFTGTALLIDPAFDLSLALLTNRVINDAEDGSRFLRWRRLWLNTVAAGLV